jgi:hypothetical protein
LKGRKIKLFDVSLFTRSSMKRSGSNSSAVHKSDWFKREDERQHRRTIRAPKVRSTMHNEHSISTTCACRDVDRLLSGFLVFPECRLTRDTSVVRSKGCEHVVEEMMVNISYTGGQSRKTSFRTARRYFIERIVSGVGTPSDPMVFRISVRNLESTSGCCESS